MNHCTLVYDDDATLRRRLAERSALLASLERRMAECKTDIANRQREHRRLADRYNTLLCTFMYLFCD
jgi:hypothetical protein